MNFQVGLILFVACTMAAVGQILLRLGAAGRNNAVEFFNPMLISGLGLFFVATALWVYGLSKAPLHLVYPFTMLTFVLVGVSSAVFLGERVGLMTVGGWVVICLGIGIIYWGAVSQ